MRTINTIPDCLEVSGENPFYFAIADKKIVTKSRIGS